jgi:exosortase
MTAPGITAEDTAMAAPQARFGALSWCARLNLLLLALGTAALAWLLWPEWRHNPDLSHGLFMPLVFLLLLHEARRHGTARFVRAGPLATTAFALLLVAGLLALSAAGLYAAAVDWTHALVAFVLTGALVFFLGAAVLGFASERVRFIGLNWPAAVAVVLWLLSTPLPPGSYSRLTVALQLWVSEGVLRTLHVLGIAAVRHGNIIEMARSTVGVEEACSGIRSLLSCVFAGLFLSAMLVRRPWARAVIVGLSVPLALGMNFLRSLALTLLANAGVDIAGAWHDTTGFAVLGVTAALLAGLALLLERTNPGKTPPATGRAPHAAAPATSPAAPASAPRLPATAALLSASGAARPKTSRLQFALTGALALAAALVTLFVLNTRPSIRRDLPVPDLFALLPPTPAGWQVSSTNLYEFAGTLQTDHLAQRRYAKLDAAGHPVELTIYVAYWPAGQAPVSLVALHTPDACWPGSGWAAQPTANARADLVTAGRALPPAEYRLFTSGDYPQHVWFWHLYDGRPIDYRDPYSAQALLHIALDYGFRHNGDQLFVRVSCNRPWSEIAAEPVLAEFFAHTRALGL